MPAVLSPVVTDLVAAAEKLRADDRLVLSPEQQLNEFEALRDTVTSLHAQMVRRLREIWHTEAAEQVSGRSTKAWLTEEMFVAGVERSRLLRLVHQLRCYPTTEAAFDTAQISMAHAVAIICALQTLPQHLRATVEPPLVAFARFAPPEAIAAFVDELLDRLGLDKASDARRERRHAQRGVDLHKTLHGTRSLSGTLTPDVGQALEQALALAGSDTPCSPDDDRTPRQRAHDALGVIAHTYLANNGTPSFNAVPRTMVITMDLETLENQLLNHSLRLPDGATISAATARRLACNAGHIPVVLGRSAETVDIGRIGQEFTTTVRREAYIRDGGTCAFPRCQGPLAELHHIRYKRHGGPGTLHNAAWLCTFHHWLLHERGWTLQRTTTGDYLWTGPFGQQRIRKLGTASPPSRSTEPV